MRENPVTILLAEDDHDDRYLIGEALDESGFDNRLFIVSNGEELLDYLKNRGAYANKAKYPRPGVILLDLKMPLMDGREALTAIKKDPDLKSIPIIVLTTSKADEDINETYRLGITGFITKPMAFSELVNVMKSVGNYWFEAVTLPQT
jgi:CheY-like chemotaxis protein